MSNLKISSDLFLEQQELNRLVSFVKTEGYEKVNEFGRVGVGVIYNPIRDPQFNNFKVVVSSIEGKVDLPFDNYAVDGKGNIIYQKPKLGITLPLENQSYWIKISYNTSSLEKGTVSIDTDGRLTGQDTKFTEILRAGNYANKVKFNSNLNNNQEYTVIQVISDTDAILAGNFTAEQDIEYSCIGSFSEGLNPPQQNKLIYQYDSCTIELVPSNSTAPPPVTDSQLEFFVAQVSRNGNTVKINDRRTSIFDGSGNFTFLPTTRNQVFGVDRVHWNVPDTTKADNIVALSWGLHCSSYFIDPTLRQVTVNTAVGGRYKDVSYVQQGDFNGWRLYFPDGTFSTIIETTIQGAAFTVTLDMLTAKISIGEILNIVPSADFIEVSFTPVLREATQLRKTEIYHINDTRARKQLAVYNRTSSKYELFYRYITGKNTSAWLRPLQDEVGYFTEENFDAETGRFIVGQDRVVTPYINAVELIAHPNHYATFAFNIDLGDLLRVNARQLSFNSSQVDLVVGTDSQVQIFEGTVVLASDIIINLPTSDIRSGNRFVLIFDADISPNGNNVLIYNGFNSNGSELLYSLTPTDLDYQKWNTQKVVIECYCDGIKWYTTVVENDNSVLGDIKHKMSVPSAAFDSSGLGQIQGYYGWALCNGENGAPDIPGHILINQDGSDSRINSAGKKAGAKAVTITSENLPKHTHNAGTLETREDSHTHKIFTRDSGSDVGRFRDANDGRGGNRELSDPLDGKNTDEYTHKHTLTGATADGAFENTALNILPLVYTTVMIARVKKQ